MKFIALLAIFCLAGIASSKTLVGSWTVNDTCSNFCCCPAGVLTISADTTNTSQVIVQSTQWDSNPICTALNITDASSTMTLPFSSIATLDNLQDIVGAQVNGDDGIIYILEGITKKGIINPTYSILLEVDQASVGGQICAYTFTSSPHGETSEEFLAASSILSL